MDAAGEEHDISPTGGGDLAVAYLLQNGEELEFSGQMEGVK